jgi:hypothetical protein
MDFSSVLCLRGLQLLPVRCVALLHIVRPAIRLSLDLGTRAFDFVHQSSLMGQSTEMVNDYELSNAMAEKSRQ